MQNPQEAHYEKIFDRLLKNPPSEDEKQFLETALITAIQDSNMEIIQLYDASWFDVVLEAVILQHCSQHAQTRTAMCSSTWLISYAKLTVAQRLLIL